MAEHTLWDGSEVPATLNANDGGSPGVVVGTGCLFGAGGEVVGVQFRATTTVGAAETYTVAIWRGDTPATGTLLASKSVTGAEINDSAWNRVDFDTPVAVDDEHAYFVGVWNSGGRYVFTQAYFNGTARGNLSTVYAWATGADISGVAGAGWEAVTNGRSLINTALAFPTSSFDGSCFFVGPVWEDSPTPPASGDAGAMLAFFGED